MNALQKYSPNTTPAFDESRLSKNEYTVSLMREALRLEIITEAEELALQAKLMNHVAAVIDEFTDGKSQSLSNDKTNELFSALLYNLDAYFISLKNPTKAFSELNEKTVSFLYDNGGAALKRVQADCAALLFNVKKTRLVGATESYNRTIDEDVRSFLKQYNIRFAAHKNPIVPRYKTAIAPGGTGVVKMKRFLANLLCENMFCRSYESDEVISVVSFEVMRSNEMGRDIGNLYIPLLLCAVICQFLIPGVPHVLLSEEDVNHAAMLLDEYSPDELRTVLMAAFSRLPKENSFYHQKVFESQLPGLIHAIKHGHLKTLIAYMPINNQKPNKGK